MQDLSNLVPASDKLTRAVLANDDQDIASIIFNLKKADYEDTPLFFGEQPGLLDSINKQYPRVWSLYKHQKSLDWAEDEYDYRSCVLEFERDDRPSYFGMIRTLAWQWEADSIAARSIMAILGPVISSSELKVAYDRIVDNENLHALTYSEITRMSFRNPADIMREILSIRESQDRLVTIGRVFQEAWQFSAWYNYQLAQGKHVEVTQDMYNKIFMFMVALLVLERDQFMSSFATTFAFGEESRYIPIAKAVRRVCQDEFEVHVQVALEVISIELRTERGRRALAENRDRIIALINEVWERETEWNQYNWSDGLVLKNLNQYSAQEFTNYSVYAVAAPLGLADAIRAPKVTENPLGYFEKWVNISNTQTSPQEEQNDQYKLNVVRDDMANSSRILTQDFGRFN